MRYTTAHEWVTLEDGIATVGLQERAKEHIGEVVNMRFSEVGTKVKAGDSIGILESNKSAIELYAPLGGEIVEVAPDFNSKGLYKLKLLNNEEYETLLDKEQYEKDVLGGKEI